MSVFIFDENDDARQCGSYYPEIVDQAQREREKMEGEKMECEKALVK
jgi:hypothetical protein